MPRPSYDEETARRSTAHRTGRRAVPEATDGASRARTGDLCDAIAALSQLSYGPRRAISLAPALALAGERQPAAASASATEGTSLHSSSSR
jgi:hypothetical protein